MTELRMTGLVAAVHTPFDADGELDLAQIEKQWEWLSSQNVSKLFIGGSTGESHSMTCDERRRLAHHWAQVTRGTEAQLIVHVGSNCLPDARRLAMEAGGSRAAAISALAPSYFKPQDLDALLAWCREIASTAPETPFYYYDIPGLTGVRLSMPQLLERIDETIPNFAGLKFSNPDLDALQRCLQVRSGGFDIAFGIDEWALAALALGVTGFVGSTYNFAAPITQQIIAAFERQDLSAARSWQLRSVQLVGTLAGYGYMAASKALMEMLGVPVGSPRPPHTALDDAAKLRLRHDLEQLGFFDWIAEGQSSHTK